MKHMMKRLRKSFLFYTNTKGINFGFTLSFYECEITLCINLFNINFGFTYKRRMKKRSCVKSDIMNKEQK